MLVYTVDQKIGFRKVVENQIRIQPKQADRLERMPADQRETAMQQQTGFWRVFSYAGPSDRNAFLPHHRHRTVCYLQVRRECGFPVQKPCSHS
jgi:hypothetical protein